MSGATLPYLVVVFLVFITGMSFGIYFMVLDGLQTVGSDNVVTPLFFLIGMSAVMWLAVTRFWNDFVMNMD